MELVNGREYPLWGNLVDRKEEFIGGIITGEEGWLTFSGYGGHEFRIQKLD